MDYVTLKWLHVISATLLFGAGVGSAFHLVLSAIGRDVHDIAATTNHVVIQDWVFTATTAVFQPLSGLWLVHMAGLPLSTRWVEASLWLYAVAIACWLPVVWIQLRLRDIARRAAGHAQELPRSWWRLFAVWVALGLFAFGAFLAIFHLMVAKPA
jgi:uncharacterized membrane protein